MGMPQPIIGARCVGQIAKSQEELARALGKFDGYACPEGTEVSILDLGAQRGGATGAAQRAHSVGQARYINKRPMANTHCP